MVKTKLFSRTGLDLFFTYFCTGDRPNKGIICSPFVLVHFALHNCKTIFSCYNVESISHQVNHKLNFPQSISLFSFIRGAKIAGNLTIYPQHVKFVMRHYICNQRKFKLWILIDENVGKAKTTHDGMQAKQLCYLIISNYYSFSGLLQIVLCSRPGTNLEKIVVQLARKVVST